LSSCYDKNILKGNSDIGNLFIIFYNYSEISSCRVNTDGNKRYFVDLKQSKNKEQTQFVKISELSNGKRSTIVIGNEGDVHHFAAAKLRQIFQSMNASLGQYHQCSRISFSTSRSQKRKKTRNLTVFFTLSRSACVITAHRTLMKLKPRHIINCPKCSTYNVQGVLDIQCTGSPRHTILRCPSFFYELNFKIRHIND
jgi:hypothetical protein